ncbi:MAG: MBL fold metallo-hydrolase [Candidatus Zixiibacteriota bacterium]
MKITTLDLGEYKPVLISPGVGLWRFDKKLPLATEPAQLRLIALGVGGAFSARMFQSNFIIVKGQTTLFVDFGSKTTLKLAEFGLSAHAVKHLLVTHSHADHIGSLEELALKRRYEAPFIEMPKGKDESMPDYFARITKARNEGRFRPVLHIPPHYEKMLWDWSLRGGLAFSEITNVQDPKGEMLLSHYFDVAHPRHLPNEGVDSWEIVVEGANPADTLRVQTFLANHIPDTAKTVDESLYTTGFIIDGRVLVSGDTKFDEQMVNRFGDRCEVIFHDCQHFPGGVHAAYQQLKNLPEAIRKKMILYHLSDGMLDIDVAKDGFLGLMQPAPVVYDF